MTNTENLYKRIAEQEGCHYERGAFLVIDSSDWYSVKEFCFVLIEKYKLNPEWLKDKELWRVVYLESTRASLAQLDKIL